MIVCTLPVGVTTGVAVVVVVVVALVVVEVEEVAALVVITELGWDVATDVDIIATDDGVVVVVVEATVQ